MKRRKTRATVIATGFRKHRQRRFGLSALPNAKLILLTTLFICGMLLGIGFIKHTDEMTFLTLQEMVENHYTRQSEQPLIHQFFSQLFSEGLYLLVSAVLGVCLAGEPFLWLLPVVKGIGIGTVSGCLYKAFTLSGLRFYASFLLLPTVVSGVCLLLAAHESILFSRDMNRALFQKNSTFSGTAAIKLYALRYLVLSILLLVSVAVGVSLTVVFRDEFMAFLAEF